MIVSKRLICGSLTLILILAFGLTGCGGSTGETTGTGQQSGPLNLLIGTASTSGSSYMYGTAFAETVNKNCDTIQLTPVATGGTADNIERMRKGSIKIGLTSSDWLYQAYNGIDMPEYKDIRVLWAMYDEYFHMITNAKNPETTIYDFKGKKVSFGNEGSGSYAASSSILECLDLSFDDFDARYLPTGESIQALEDEQIYAMVTITGSPHPGTMSLAATMPGGIKLISLSDEDIKKVQEVYPYMGKTVIPKGTYTGVDYDAVGVGGQRYLATTADLPDEVAYTIAKTVHENYNQLVQSYAGAADSTAEKTAAATIVPIHPGVRKFLEEIGAL